MTWGGYMHAEGADYTGQKAARPEPEATLPFRLGRASPSTSALLFPTLFRPDRVNPCASGTLASSRA